MIFISYLVMKACRSCQVPETIGSCKEAPRGCTKSLLIERIATRWKKKYPIPFESASRSYQCSKVARILNPIKDENPLWRMEQPIKNSSTLITAQVAEMLRHVHDSNRLGRINRLHPGNFLHHSGADIHDIVGELVQLLRDLYAVQEKQVIDGGQLKPTHVQDGREADKEEAAAGAAIRGGEPELDAVLHERVRHARHLPALLPAPERSRLRRGGGGRRNGGAGRGLATREQGSLRVRRKVGRREQGGRRRGAGQ
uniref:Uncharacterized protein n=1 Tax=Arundo donax TaxID=35708 RepID=A0A0A9EYP4_ARUDO